MSTQRLALTGLLIIALLAPGMSLAEPASKADSASGTPAKRDYPATGLDLRPGYRRFGRRRRPQRRRLRRRPRWSIRRARSGLRAGSRLLRLAYRAGSRAGLGADRATGRLAQQATSTATATTTCSPPAWTACRSSTAPRPGRFPARPGTVRRSASARPATSTATATTTCWSATRTSPTGRSGKGRCCSTTARRQALPPIPTGRSRARPLAAGWERRCSPWATSTAMATATSPPRAITRASPYYYQPGSYSPERSTSVHLRVRPQRCIWTTERSQSRRLQPET